MELEEEDAAIDEDLFATVMGYLTIQPSNAEIEKASPKKKTAAAGKRQGGSLSLDEFVSMTFPLIDLEKAAEIAQVGSDGRTPCKGLAS